MLEVNFSLQRTSTGFTINAYSPGYGLVGTLTATDTDRSPIRGVRGVMMVTYIEVASDIRRGGIGTRLYEEAAKTSCELYGKPLGSDTARSGAAEGFWAKQEAKGRVQVVPLGALGDDFEDEYEVEDEPEEYDYIYLLSCPPPASLKGWPFPRSR